MSRVVQVQRTIRRRPEGEYKSPRTQRNAWEQQADEAASRFAKSRPIGARWLTPAATASYSAPSSPGIPLPLALRTELERGFDADLGEVRIHRDSAAGAAAREENASAFAAGRDIFFDEGAAAFDTASGRELLVHEVAHVLQQTARPGADGRMRATPAGGHGDVQRKGEGSKLRRALHLDFDKLADAHRAEAGDGTEFNALVSAVRDALGGSLDETSQKAADFEAGILRKDSKIWRFVQQSEAAAGYVFDVLKFIDRFAGAAMVLQHSLLLQTYAPLAEMAKWYIEHDGRNAHYFDEIASEHPLLRRYWPGRFFDTFVVLLYGPTRAIPTLTDNTGKPWADALQEYNDSQKTQALDDNELIYSETGDLLALDKERIRVMTLLNDEVGNRLDHAEAPVSSRLELSFGIQRWGREWKEDPLKLKQLIGEKIEGIAQGAVRYWNAAISTDFKFQIAQPAAKTAKGAPDRPAARVVPADKLFTEKLPDALLAAASIFFKVKPGLDLPEPATYASQLTGGVANLKHFLVDNFELKLIELARKGAANDDFAVAIGAFLFWFQQTFKFVAEYKTELDTDFQKKFQGYPDVRFAHRLHLARAMFELTRHLQAAAFPHWKALLDQLNPILENKGEGRSRLAILGEWTPQSAPIAAIASDFEKGFTGKEAPLPAAELANLFLLVYFRDLTGELQTELGTADQDLKDPRAALRRKSILNRAVEVVDAHSRPVRYAASNWDYADNPTESQKIGEKDPVQRAEVFYQLVLNHPKTVKLEQDEAARGRQLLLANVPYSAAKKELFLWSIPDPDTIFRTLRGIDGVNSMIASQAHVPLDNVKHATDEAWIAMLAQAAGGVADMVRHARIDTTEAVRRAVSHERRLIAKLLKLVLPSYTGHSDRSYDLPLDILERIKSFGYWAVPVEERAAQLTALMLAIAPELFDVLKDETRFDIITAYFGFLTLALAGSEGAAIATLSRDVPDASERSQLVANRNFLERLRDKFDERRGNVQERHGLGSEDGESLKSVTFREEIKPHFRFLIDAERFELQKVFRPFLYNPPYGYEGTPAYRPPLMDGKLYYKDYQPTGAPLFHILRNGHRVVVTDKDIEDLNFYTRVVEEEANIIGLPALIELAGKAAKLGLDLAEYIPEVGEGVAAARTIAVVLQFFASEDFKEIKAILTKDPTSLLTLIGGKLKDVLTAESLIIFLLFPTLPGLVQGWLTAIESPPGSEKEKPTEPDTLLGKLIAIVKGIGRGFARAWGWLKDAFKAPVRNFQHFILTHPLLAFLIDLVADNLHRVADVKSWIARSSRKGEFDAEIKGTKEVVRDHMKEMLRGMTRLTLPHRVVPTEKIIQAVLEMVLGRLGPEERLILRDGLRETGILGRISRMIESELITGTAVDPNEYWRTYVVTPLQERFDNAHQALIEDVFDFLAGVLNFGNPEEEKIGITITGDDNFPEADTFMDGDMQSPHSMPMSRPGPGVPLAGSLRGNAELRFGHDFSHVRLHTGSEAAAITAPVGAAALTTGSHVYMNPEVPLSSPKGRHVFDHELTHVLQQAGSRPLGGDYNANPSFGRAGGGIRHDNVQEAAAERVARSVGGRDGGAPIDPGPARTAAGYQPAALGLTTVRRALRKLTDIESAKEGQHEIDRRAGLKTELDADQILIGRRIWDGVRNMIPTAELPKSDPNLDSVRAEFVEYFKGLKSNIDDVVPQIAFGVSETAKKKDAGDQETATRVVKPKKFARALEDYLLARSGLLVNITLDDADVKSVEVKTLLLAMVGAGKLWEKAMSRVPGDKVAELRPLLREKLRTLNTKTTFLETPPDGSFPSMVSVWEKGEFVFNAKLIGLVLNLAELNRTKGRPTDLPKFKDYINYRDQYSPKIGIRIGKYGDANQSGPDRESHHTTQFLLIEYFRNKSGDKPFPPELRSTLKAAGVVFEGAGNQTKHLEVPGKPDIDFKALDTGDRGEAMPAILISRPTHRGAALHVSGAEADDFPTGGIPVTQGGKVHSTFNNKLVEAGASGIANAGPDQLYRAIQDTYGWMHRYMMAALFKGLRENELIYYGEIVAGPHTKDGHLDPDYVTWPDQMAPVFNAAQDNNDKVMSEKGWVA